jgi:hypothetical protein
MIREVVILILILTALSIAAPSSGEEPREVNAWNCSPIEFHFPRDPKEGDALTQQKVRLDEFTKIDSVYFYAGPIWKYYGSPAGQHVLVAEYRGNKDSLRLGLSMFVESKSPVTKWILRNKLGQMFPVTLESRDYRLQDYATIWRYWLSSEFPTDYTDSRDEQLQLRLDAMDGDRWQYEFELKTMRVKETLQCLKGKRPPL